MLQSIIKGWKPELLTLNAYRNYRISIEQSIDAMDFHGLDFTERIQTYRYASLNAGIDPNSTGRKGRHFRVRQQHVDEPESTLNGPGHHGGVLLQHPRLEMLLARGGYPACFISPWFLLHRQAVFS